MPPIPKAKKKPTYKFQIHIRTYEGNSQFCDVWIRKLEGGVNVGGLHGVLQIETAYALAGATNLPLSVDHAPWTMTEQIAMESKKRVKRLDPLPSKSV